MGGASRRFLNLIVAGCSPGVKSLCRVSLTRHQLFYSDDGDGPSAGLLQDAAALSPIPRRRRKMGALKLPGPTFTFRASEQALKMDCFPLADCKVICMDESGRGFFFDLGARKAGTMPPLRKPSAPVALFVPKPDVDTEISYACGSSLFLMERNPIPEVICAGVHASEQFVGFINHNPSPISGNKSWHCHLLAPPLFLRDPRNWWNNDPEITAYGVVGGGSHACISVQGLGTHCLDTVTHTWSEVGKWALPFHGKIEYVPELKLWFGLSADTHRLAAADLSRMDHSSQPQPVGVGPWKELIDPPEEWEECKEPQFVSLGSGRFCVARFFQAASKSSPGSAGDHENFAVLTGVEVSSRGSSSSGDVQLHMTPHISKRVNSDYCIEALF